MRLAWMLAVSCILIFTALSTGSAPLMLLGILGTLTAVYAVVSVNVAVRSVCPHLCYTPDRVRRGEPAWLEIAVNGIAPLPVAPFQLICENMEQQGGRVTIPVATFHVGPAGAAVPKIICCDIFGLYRRSVRLPAPENELLVLPIEWESRPLSYASGDAAYETIARATEDISSPSDVRAYQPGDPMNRIHWKLSIRKNEVLVRRFEEPELPEAVLLMDCSAPPVLGEPERTADLRDALLETAWSVGAEEMRRGYTVRMPLQGNHPAVFQSGMGAERLAEMLARVDFTEVDRFERVLSMEAGRLLHTGSVTVIAARVNSAMVELMLQIRRTGASVRFCMVTAHPQDERILKMTARLRHGDVETEIVTPVSPDGSCK